MTIILAYLIGLYAGYRIGKIANQFLVPNLLTYKTYKRINFSAVYNIIDSYEIHGELRDHSSAKSPVLPYHQHIEALRRYEDEAYQDHVSYHKKIAMIYLKSYYKHLILLFLTAVLFHVLIIFLISFLIGFIASAIPLLRNKHATDNAWILFVMLIAHRAYYAYSQDKSLTLSTKIPQSWQHLT